MTIHVVVLVLSFVCMCDFLQCILKLTRLSGGSIGMLVYDPYEVKKMVINLLSLIEISVTSIIILIGTQ